MQNTAKLIKLKNANDGTRLKWSDVYIEKENSVGYSNPIKLRK